MIDRRWAGDVRRFWVWWRFEVVLVLMLVSGEEELYRYERQREQQGEDDGK